MRAQGRVSGFTLLELLVTIAVAGILLAIAIPSFSGTMASNRLTTGTNEFVSAINEARMEAIRRNTTTQVCAASGNGTGDLATACGSTNMGAVFALAADPDDDPILIRAPPPLSTTLHVANFQALRFNAQGLGRRPDSSGPHTGRVLDLTSDRISTANHRCVYMTAGAILKTCASDTSCDASTEPTACQ